MSLYSFIPNRTSSYIIVSRVFTLHNSRVSVLHKVVYNLLVQRHYNVFRKDVYNSWFYLIEILGKNESLYTTMGLTYFSMNSLCGNRKPSVGHRSNISSTTGFFIREFLSLLHRHVLSLYTNFF